MQADWDQVDGVCGQTVKVGTRVDQTIQTSGKAGGRMKQIGSGRGGRMH
jgi:hypothetical protein